jgi:hypothetical protein
VLVARSPPAHQPLKPTEKRVTGTDAQLAGGNTSEAVMAEYTSQVAEALNRLADVGDRIAVAGELLAGAIFSVAAGAHSDCDYRQREMAGVFYADAKDRFKDVLRKATKADRDKMHRYIDGICKSGKK